MLAVRQFRLEELTVQNLTVPASSTIIQEIGTMQKSGLASLTSFYHDSKEDQKRDLRGLLSSVLVQLCYQFDNYCDILSQFYWKYACGSQYPNDDALVRCLEDVLRHPGQAPIFLLPDALDECPNSSTMLSARESVLMFVKELMDSQLPTLRICVAIRTDIDIKAVLEPLASHSVSIHDESGQIEDIENHIKSVVNTDPRIRRWKKEDKHRVIDVLTQRADGM